MTDNRANIAAGWYPSYDDAGVEQYWDGAVWTDQKRSKSVPPVPPLPPVPPVAGAAPNVGVSFGKALFDLSFSDFVTLKFAKFLFVLGIVVNTIAWIGGAILSYIGAAIGSSALSYYGSNSGGLFVAPTIWLLLGWIPALLGIIVLRVVLEFIVASVRTAQNTSILAGTSKR